MFQDENIELLRAEITEYFIMNFIIAIWYFIRMN